VYDSAAGMRAAADRLTDGEFEREHDADDTVVALRREPDHVVVVRMHTVDADQWRPILLLREYLTDHPDAREEYARVKREAAAEHPDDMEAYTNAKFDLVQSLTEAAREAGYEDRLPAFA